MKTPLSCFSLVYEVEQLKTLNEVYWNRRELIRGITVVLRGKTV
jgi:hypothetical protein